MTKLRLSDILDSLHFGDKLFKTLKNIEPLHSPCGGFTFSAGRQSVVCKVLHNNTPHALKCYLRTQSTRKPRYDYLTNAPNKEIFIRPQFFAQELYVNDCQIDVALYEWTEGHTLDWMIRKALHDCNSQLLEQLLGEFLRLATTILEGEWRHGDLKADNIIVCPDGRMKLIDCDALYAPSLPPSEERGTPLWVHPARGDNYDSHIDDYATALIVVSLAAIKGDLSLCKGESAVAMPSQQNRAAIDQLIANNEPLLALHNALYASSYKIENLKKLLECIAHQSHDNTKPLL